MNLINYSYYKLDILFNYILAFFLQILTVIIYNYRKQISILKLNKIINIELVA